MGDVAESGVRPDDGRASFIGPLSDNVPAMAIGKPLRQRSAYHPGEAIPGHLDPTDPVFSAAYRAALHQLDSVSGKPNGRRSLLHVLGSVLMIGLVLLLSALLLRLLFDKPLQEWSLHPVALHQPLDIPLSFVALGGAIAGVLIFWMFTNALRLPSERIGTKISLMTVVALLCYEFALLL